MTTKQKPINLHARAEFILTYRCNLACTYCHMRDMPQISMSSEIANKSLETFFEIASNFKYLSISFTGGEPLIEFDLLKSIVERAKRLSERDNKITAFSMFTNATLLNKKTIEFVKENNIELLISIDGANTIHDANRKYIGNTNSFLDALQKTRKVLEEDIDYKINMSVSEENAKFLYSGVKTLVENGIYHFKIGPIYKQKDWAKDNSKSFCNGLKKVCRDANKWLNGKKLISISPIDRQTRHVNNKLKGVWGCSAGLSNLAFTPDGHIIGCSSMAPLVNYFPNFKIGTIEKLFKDEDLKYFSDLRQENPERRKKCANCKSKDNCSGGCLAINATETGDPLTPPEHYCDAIKAIPDAWSSLWGKGADKMIIEIQLESKETIRIPIRRNAYRQIEIIESIKHNYVSKNSSKIEIRNIFTEKNRMEDAWRYSLKKGFDGKYKISPLKNRSKPFIHSKYIDRTALKANSIPTVVIIIESPHKDEYSYRKNFSPIAPAQGRTGEKINGHFEELFNSQIAKDLSRCTIDEFNIVICNPIQFQTSLFEIHKYPLSHPGAASIRDRVWLALMEHDRLNFGERLIAYKPKIIINACTAKLKSKVNRIIKETKGLDLGLFYRADSHPCMWHSHTKFQKTG